MGVKEGGGGRRRRERVVSRRRRERRWWSVGRDRFTGSSSDRSSSMGDGVGDDARFVGRVEAWL